MVEIVAVDGILKNGVYECIMDYNNPLDSKISYKKGDILMGSDIKNINDLNIQFFQLIGGKNITHKRTKTGKISTITRRPVELGDVFHVKFAKTKYKHVVVLDINEKAEMAVVHPSEYGFLPLGPLCRQQHKGWVGVNYKLDFTPPKKATYTSEVEVL